MIFPRGTRPLGLRGAYTSEQREALAAIAHSGLRLQAARAEYANRMLLADGTVSSDTDAMVASVLTSGDEKKFDEVNAMLNENRFLFVVDERGLPLVYFQCAVPGNPDVTVEVLEPPAPVVEELVVSEVEVAAPDEPPYAVVENVVVPPSWRVRVIRALGWLWSKVVGLVRRRH